MLTKGPLCVCHFQEILDIAQTKVSQHLAYLRKKGMVECTRHGTWMIYSLPSKSPLELEANLKCLQDCASNDKRFRADLKALEKVELIADGLMKLSKTNVTALARPHESK